MKRMVILSPQRVKILNLLAEGKTCEQIGEDLHISGRTVEIHIRMLRAHFKVRNVAALMIQAVKHNLIHSISCPTLDQDK